MSSSYVRYHYHFIWMLITRKQPREPQEDLERQNKTEIEGGVRQHAGSAARSSLKEKRRGGETVNLGTEKRKSERRGQPPYSHHRFNVCPLIRWQVCAGMVPCLVLRRGG